MIPSYTFNFKSGKQLMKVIDYEHQNMAEAINCTQPQPQPQLAAALLVVNNFLNNFTYKTNIVT